MKKLIFLFFFTSCTSLNSINSQSLSSKEFPKDLKYEEFKKFLNEYVNFSTYPNIDK